MLVTILLSLLSIDYFYKNLWPTDTSNHIVINDMIELMEKQQKREDAIRQECREAFTNKKYVHGFSTYIKNTYHKAFLYILDTESIHASTYDDFINLSHEEENIQKYIIYEDITYRLIQSGEETCNLSYICSTRNPIWTTNLGSHELTITNII